MKIKATIREYNGGKYGKMGEYEAIIIPEFFKNGNIKHSQFKVCEHLQTNKKGYNYHGMATVSYQISSIKDKHGEYIPMYEWNIKTLDKIANIE